MTAEPIARVIDDLRKGRVRHMLHDRAGQVVNGVALERAQQADTVVDATGIYWDLHDRLIVKRQEVDVYGDHPSITPPWESAIVGCVNQPVLDPGPRSRISGRRGDPEGLRVEAMTATAEPLSCERCHRRVVQTPVWWFGKPLGTTCAKRYGLTPERPLRIRTPKRGDDDMDQPVLYGLEGEINENEE